MCTTLGNSKGVTISTVEHLMAALSGCHVDNAIVEVSGSEVPVMDGSAQPFVFLIECAGVKQLDASRRVIEVLRPCLLYTSPSPRDVEESRMPSSA